MDDLATRIIASYRTKLFKMAGRSGPVGFDAIELAIRQAVEEETADSASDDTEGQGARGTPRTATPAPERDNKAVRGPQPSVSDAPTFTCPCGDYFHVPQDFYEHVHMVHDVSADDAGTEYRVFPPDPKYGQRHRSLDGVVHEFRGRGIGWERIKSGDDVGDTLEISSLGPPPTLHDSSRNRQRELMEQALREKDDEIAALKERLAGSAEADFSLNAVLHRFWGLEPCETSCTCIIKSGGRVDGHSILGLANVLRKATVKATRLADTEGPDA